MSSVTTSTTGYPVPGSLDSPANVQAGAPGLPPINTVAASGANPVILTSDTISQFAVLGPQWGIFQSGVQVVTAQSVASVEYRQDWTISDYPIEGGQFESYDKVAIPFLAKVRFAQGGDLTDRSELLQSIAAIAGTLNVYDVVTPEATYVSCTVSHYDYRRTANQGLGLVVVDVWLSQVLVQNAGGLSASSVQSPSGADPASNGQIGTSPATSQQTTDLQSSGLAVGD